MSYAKLSSTITESSLWSRSKETRILFIAMLARCNAVGFIEASVSGLARVANLTLEETQTALADLMSPDTESKSKALEGRRVVEVERGFVVVNYEEQRKQRDEEERREYMREYMREYRKTGKPPVNDVNDGKPGKPQLAQAEAEAEAERERDVNSLAITSSTVDSKAGTISLSRRDKQRACLVSLGAIMVKDGADLLDEWLTVAKGCKEAELRSIFETARPGIQWPSDFRHERESPVR